jgi:tRNA A-37 threonylcarbamoyl transferase component Bud32
MPGPKRKYTVPNAKRSFFRMKNVSRGQFPPSEVKTYRLRKWLKKYFVRAHKGEEPREIMEELRAAGLRVEDPGRASRKNVTVSPEIGDSLYHHLLSNNPKSTEKLLSQAFELIGKVHARGIMHGHPHMNNFFVKDGKVWLADFKLAERVSPDWNSAEDILHTFRKGHGRLGSVLRGASNLLEASPLSKSPNSAKLRRTCLEIMVSQYPCSEEVRQEVIERLLGKLGA